MIEAVGTTALGIFLGYMAWYFATRVTDNWMDSFAAVAGVLFGGVVLAFLGGTGAESRWWYPIGLVGGWVIYVILRVISGGGVPTVTAGRGVEYDAAQGMKIFRRGGLRGSGLGQVDKTN